MELRNSTMTVLLICVLIGLEAQAQSLVYPKAKQTTQTDNYHGFEVPDPYRWMEAANAWELQSWLKAEDELIKKFVVHYPLRSKIENRLSELNVYENYTNSIAINTPYVSKRSSRYFFIKTPPGESIPTLFVQEGATATPKPLIHIKSRYDKEGYNLLGFEPSPDGKRVAVFLAANADRWLTVKVFDVDTGQETRDTLTGIHRQSGNISWSNDSRGFYYTKFEKREQGSGQPPIPSTPKIYFHSLGNSQSADTFVFGDIINDRTRIFAHATSDGKYLLITSLDGSSTRSRVYYKELSNPNARAKPIFDKADAAYTFLGNKKTQFWFFTNKDASRGRVITFDINQPDYGNWKETVPESKDVISANSSVGGNALGMFGDKIVLLYARDSNPVLKVFGLNGKLQKEITLRSGGTIFGGFSGRQNESELLYQFLDITSPASFYRLDVSNYQNLEFLRPQLKLDPQAFETRQVFYTSKDGTRVPMFIAHRKGIKLNGSNPTYMYAYGAAAWVAFMWYQPEMITWMEMGGIYAVPGIRGGGEYGEEWHQAGIRRKKQNAVDDYLGAAEWLIKAKYTNPAKLVANGGSGSGATVAAAAIQRPELFGALLIDRPFLDMLRYDKYSNGMLWVPEFGTADDPEEFRTLISYSPYHNLKQGQCYPPTLVMIGDQDQVTLPFHSFKFVARMQDMQGCAKPVMLKVMKGAGHNFGQTPQQRVDSWTDALSFLWKVLNDYSSRVISR